MNKAIKYALIAFLVLAACFYGIIEGIRNKIAGAIGLSAEQIGTLNADETATINEKDTFTRFVAPADKPFNNYLDGEQAPDVAEYEISKYLYILKDQDINGQDGENGIRPDLINIGSVDMDRVGLDSLTLKKMKLVYTASRTADGGVILAELADEIKDKDGNTTEYEVQKVTNPEQYWEDHHVEFNLTEHHKEKLMKLYECKDEYIEEAPWNPTLELHYIPGFRLDPEDEDTSEEGKGKIFWFKDNGSVDPLEPNKFYIGAEGVIHVTTDIEDNDDEDGDGTKGEIIYRDKDTVVETHDPLNPGMFDRYKELVENGQGESEEAQTLKKEILKSGQMNNEGQVVLYTITTTDDMIEYSFGGPGENAQNSGMLNATCELGEQPVNLEDMLDFSKIAISVELTSDLLDLTGSHEFSHLFMSYALNKTDVEIKAYSEEDEVKDYITNKYDILDDFTAVIGNFGSIADINAYKAFTNNSQFLLSDIINQNQDLKTGYEQDRSSAMHDLSVAQAGFQQALSAGTSTAHWQSEINKASQALLKANTELDKVVADLATLARLKSNTLVEKVASTAMGSGGIIATVMETKIHVTDVVSWKPVVHRVDTWYTCSEYTDPTIEYRFMANDGTAKEIAFGSASELSNYYALKKFTEDLNPVKTNSPINSEVSNNKGWGDILGHASILTGDATNFSFQNFMNLGNLLSGSLSGSSSDYVNMSYNTSDRKIYNSTSHYSKMVDESSIAEKEISGQKEQRIKEFLALLANEKATVEYGLQTGEFNREKDSYVVKYDDIYNGDAKVGDLIENGAEMLFKLLDDSTRTECLVNVFKYIIYLYSGNVFDGITSVDQIDSMFVLTPAYSGSDYVIDTSKSDSKLVLTKSQLEEAIKKTYSGQVQANLLSCLDDFMEIQNNNNVNSVFAVAVAIIESSGGTNWAAIDPSTYNMYSIKGGSGWRSYSSFNEAVDDFGDLIANGSYYFQQGKYTVTEIAPTYCNEAWGTSVVSEMNKLYKSLGISTGVTGGIEGESNGVTTITVGDKTYKNFKQINQAYKNVPLANYGGTSLYYSGCAVTSVSIICSAFGEDVSPVAINNYEASIKSTYHPGVVTHYTGIPASWNYNYSSSAVVEQLKRGYPTIVYIGPNSGRWSTSRGHFFTILSVSDDGSMVYVSDPASNNPNRTGWLPVSAIQDSALQRYMVMGN